LAKTLVLAKEYSLFQPILENIEYLRPIMNGLCSSEEWQDSEEEIGKLAARYGMTWQTGWAGSWKSDIVRDYGISTIPAMVMIAPDGKVLLSNPLMAELVMRIDELRK
jgi:hypothetical protein